MQRSHKVFVDGTSLFAPEGRAGRLRQNAKLQNRKNSKSQKLQIAEIEISKTFIEILLRDQSRNWLPQDGVLVLQDQRQDFSSQSLCAPFTMCEVHI
jgi:hypothetical protein